MSLPIHITHYFEAEYGPFLNICDLDDDGVTKLIESEKNSKTAFNRFAMGNDFLKWRRSADELLIRAYTEKFGFKPKHRPYFAVLGNFDKTLTMFREGRSLSIDVSEFTEDEITFMYPDHAHLTKHYGADVPHLFYQPHHLPGQIFWGQLYTYRELLAEYESSRIAEFIAKHIEKDGWAGCYVEAHIWCRDERTTLSEQGGDAKTDQQI